MADEGGGRRFHTTQWSVVLAARAEGSNDAAAALSTLCETYWYPLYAFARRRGLDADAAQDAAQGFFTHLLSKHSLKHVDPAKGRFRSFLLASFKHWLSDERDRAHAAKRGGGVEPLSFDADEAEDRYVREPVDETTPEKLFERRWALAVLERAIARLGGEYADPERARVFDRLKVYLTGGRGDAEPYAVAARDLGISEIAVKVAVHRLRKRFRGHLIDEITQTLERPEDLDSELQNLMAALEK